MNLDALAFDVAITADVTLLHPITRQPLRDKDGNVAYVRVVSLDSPEVQAVQKQAINKRLNARGRTKMTADELEAERAETLVAATKGWYLVSMEGDKLDVPYSPALARNLYTDARFTWIREQVNEAVEDRATFLQRGAEAT
jgi:hypothetical protein